MTTTEPRDVGAIAEDAPKTHSDRPLLHLIRDIQRGHVQPKTLSSEDRRACVRYLWGQGYSVHELAALLTVSEPTIKRDRRAIRMDNALHPSEALADEVIAELVDTAENAITRLYKAVRDPGDGPEITPHMRMRAAIGSFRIYRDLVRTLADMKYVATGDRRLNLDAMTKPYTVGGDWMAEAAQHVADQLNPE